MQRKPINIYSVDIKRTLLSKKDCMIANTLLDLILITAV